MPSAILKRNGDKADFNPDKIRQAVRKAFEAVGQPYKPSTLDYISDLVLDHFDGVDTVAVEDVQDVVENALMRASYYSVARAYVKYRYNRQLARRQNTTDESIMALLGNRNKELAEENANKNTTINATQRDYIAGEVSRDLTRRILLPERLSAAHDEGVFHFHDSDYFIQQMINCCLVNIGDMLDNGTVMNAKLIESPHSFRVACTIMTQIIACVASNQYGGQSVDLRHLGKYLRRSREKIEARVKENAKGIPEKHLQEFIDAQVMAELKSELAAGVQTIQYQINTLMTTNGFCHKMEIGRSKIA